jgi:hypothetical protein
VSDGAFITAVCLAHLTGTLNGLAIGLWISEKLNQRMARR